VQHYTPIMKLGTVQYTTLMPNLALIRARIRQPPNWKIWLILCLLAVFRPAWKTVYIDRADVCHGSIDHTQWFRGRVLTKFSMLLALQQLDNACHFHLVTFSRCMCRNRCLWAAVRNSSTIIQSGNSNKWGYFVDLDEFSCVSDYFFVAYVQNCSIST